mgnify:CR=1 FL=1
MEESITLLKNLHQSFEDNSDLITTDISKIKTDLVFVTNAVSEIESQLITKISFENLKGTVENNT